MSDPIQSAELMPMRHAERLGRLMRWANRLDLPTRQGRVLMLLIDHADDHLGSHWSHGKIGKAIGCSARVAGEAVRALEDRGLLIRKPRKRVDGTRSSDRMTVCAPADLALIRQNQRELAAVDHDGDLTPENRMESGSYETYVPGADRTHETYEHEGSSLYRSIEVEKRSARTIRASRKSRAERTLAAPRRVGAVIEQVAA